MQKINCGVKNCSHNNSGTCFANRVDVGGISASKNCDTCCGSFLDSKSYGALKNNIHGEGECSCLVCKVETCIHYNNNLCLLDSINVTGDNAKIYTETECSSFRLK